MIIHISALFPSLFIAFLNWFEPKLNILKVLNNQKMNTRKSTMHDKCGKLLSQYIYVYYTFFSL